MDIFNVCRGKAVLLLACFLCLVVSCVNEEYDMSQGNLNLEVTPFQEGLTFPLGSTDQIKLADLLKNVDGDFLNVVNGTYSFRVSDSIDDFNSQLSSLTNLVNISDIPSFSDEVPFQLEDVDVSSVRIAVQDYGFTHDMASSVKEPELDIPAISDALEMAAGVYKYAPAEGGADLEVEIAPIPLTKEKAVGMLVEVLLPDGIESVNYADFTATSGIDLDLKAENLISGLDVKLKTLEVTFPEELVINDADVVNHVLVIRDVDLTTGYKKHISISRINLPAPENGRIDYKGEIMLNAVDEVGGALRASDIPADKENDVKVVVHVSSSLVMDDYQVTMAPYPYELDFPGQEIKSDVPADLAGKNVSVYPEGNPELVIDLTFPELPLGLRPAAGKGMTMSFPKMLKFKEEEIPASYNYSLATNSVTFTFENEVPERIVLPIEKLIVIPVEENGQHYIKGDINITGGVSLDAGNLMKENVQEILGPANKISIVAHVPEIVPSTMNVDTYETTISQKVDLDIMSAGDVPEQVVGIGIVELNDATIDISMDASSIPDLGGADLVVDLTVGLPSMMKLEGVSGNVVKLTKKLDAQKKIVFDPIKVSGLDFSGVDIKKEGIRDAISIEGAIRLENATLNLDNLVGKAFNVKINAGMSKFTIASVAANVDYPLEVAPIPMDLSSLTGSFGDMGMDATLDFKHAHLALDVTTNLGVQMDADIEIIPYYGNVADEAGIIKATLNLVPELVKGNGSNSVPVTKTSKFWLAEKEDSRCPDGYQLVEVNNLLSLFRNLPDRLEIRLSGGVEPENVCYLDLNSDPVLAINYAFELPLEFGEAFNVTYKTEIKNLPAIVGEVLANGLKVKLAGEILNSLPLGLNMTLNFLDSAGNVVEAVEGAGVQAIKPCAYDAATAKVSASSSELNIVLGVKNPEKARDISSLELAFNANSKDAVGVPVTEESYLQAVIQLVLPEGITVDLKELMNSNEQ